MLWRQLTCSLRLPQPSRRVFNSSKKWPEKLEREHKLYLEDHWKSRLRQLDDKIQKTSSSLPKYYVLSMFPYPSGQLHMGHVRVYAISDAMARFQRMKGKAVVHPMGWDAFGLPAENAAIERGVAADEWTISNIANMKKQLENLSCSFDWDREFATCSSDYYRWTQDLFLQLYDVGLVYQREAAVNWDPVDQTVLADEQIDGSGCSWRSGAKVQKKYLKQWYIRVLPYLESLVKGLDEVDPELWQFVIELQRDWIGPLTGVKIEFDVKRPDGIPVSNPISVFTTDVEYVYGASHLLISEDHFLNDPKFFKEGADPNADVIQLNLTAMNPFNKKSLPIFLSRSHHFDSDVNFSSNSHLGIPSASESDSLFANDHSLDWKDVLIEGEIANSGPLNGLGKTEAVNEVLKQAKLLGCVCHKASRKSRDWLISRQRYWGTPIPMVHCPKYGTMPVSREQLPVTLPPLPQNKTSGVSPLEGAGDWLKVKCSRCDCDGYAKRETDTMDTFFDSSWYYLRYLDAKNESELCNKDKAHAGMPVDLYIGGNEHAIMHLYYARFISHFLYDRGVVPTKEPFVNLLTQGMVMGQSYQVKKSGKYLRPDEVNFENPSPVEASTGEKLVVKWEKMSKSKHNGVNPQEMLDKFGTDATRLAILANVAPKSNRHWSLEIFIGIERWQAKIWKLVGDFLAERQKNLKDGKKELRLLKHHRQKVNDPRNFLLNELRVHMNDTFLLNTAIANMQSYTQKLRKLQDPMFLRSTEYERALCDLVLVLSPFAPMFCLELWSALTSVPLKNSHYKSGLSVLEQSWPEIDSDYKANLIVRVTSRQVCTVKTQYNLSDLPQLSVEEASKLAKQHDLMKPIKLEGYQPLFKIVEGYRAEINFVKLRSKSKFVDTGSYDK
ncbi:hypothetical protein CAPTEDRAFT_228464 [Capitella teleta]|uniref:leucine--tRNA ligase n=1 Tax=Capitella teleta TaxID=283909 RepID=R7UXJ0_CAPTE|nr:hypothetical protein CAPTEDRAFT_228464 [Capitella teleta]|eukprot:ELU11054.1 hypothetical protein CAPTEDRAFT_228464 [Capitella teleta]